MKDPYFFGYGSLVNRATHSYSGAVHARIGGWKRAWRRTLDREFAFLTVIPDSECAIDGLIAPVPDADWAALDEREFAYERVMAKDVIHDLPQDPEIAIYAIAAENLSLPTKNNPILLSYLDVVLQGYLIEFGEAGAKDFLHTTTGWEAPILNDRANPIYPRHQALTAPETAFVDQALEGLGAVILRT